MKMTLNRLAIGFLGAGMLTIYGCGGGSDTPAPAPTPTPTANVPITVIDGPIQNATVCLDKNGNGLCDTGEPSDKTNASGNASLTVDAADAGKYPVIAIVGTDAIDTDRPNTPITVPFTLSAPADQTSVVSPLTTLVQQTVASTGASTADAAATVQAATGITASLFQDFTKVTAPTDGSVDAATVARMLVVTTQQQSSAIAGSLNTTAIDDSKITQADIDKAVQLKMMELLPSLVAALGNPTVLAATTAADKEAALLAAATTLVTDSGLTTSSMATVVAINTQASSTTPVAAAEPAAGFNLVNLSYTNASNYFTRLFTATLAQNTPESGSIRNVERRLRTNAGNQAKWGSGSDPWRGADLHWNGSAWANCPINFENTSGVRDSQGNSTYNYCGNRETGKSNRATFDVTGKSMSGVYTQIRAAGFTNMTIADTSSLGDATFPLGSKLHYQTNTALTNAISYYPGSSDAVGDSTVVSQYSLAVSAGGVASEQPAGVGCNSTEFQQTNGHNSTTLEGMIAAMTGTPCIFTGGSFTYNGVTYTNPDTKNEAWGNSSVNIGTIGSAPVGSGPAPGFYTTNTRLRAAFKGTGANAVTYYACKERFNNGSSRNCEPIGTGTYTIATLGDARVMTFNNLPSQSAPLTFTRVFVERGGLVYAGFQVKPIVSNSARLNSEGSTALMTQLGLTPEDPSLPLALTAGSYQGTWDLRDAANIADGGITVFIRGNGSTSCQDRSNASVFACSVTFTNPSTGAFTFSDSVSTASGTLNFLTGRASGTFNDPTSTPATGNFVGQRR